MAIADIRAGSGFNGALSYDMEKDGAEHISQSGVFSTRPDEIAREMRMVANMRDLSKPVWHASISLAPGEAATNQQMDVLGRTWLKAMGFDLDKSQFVIVRHRDREHEHIHVTVNRVQLDGKVIDDSFYIWRSHESCRIAERAAGLNPFDERSQSKSRGLMHDLRQAVDQARQASGGDLSRFKDGLQAQGLRLVEHHASTGRLQGVSYETPDGRMYKGSALGKSYAAAGLQKSGLDLGYQPGKPKDQQQGQGQSKSQGGKREQTHAAGQAARAGRSGADRAREPWQQTSGARDLNSIKAESWNRRRAGEQAKDEAEQRRKRRAAEDEDEM